MEALTVCVVCDGTGVNPDPYDCVECGATGKYLGELIVVLPVLEQSFSSRCINSVLMPNSSSGFKKSEILVVDNTLKGWGNEHGVPVYRDPNGHNLGVAGSWNVGARVVLDRGLDYLVILSVSVEFGPALHTTFKRRMQDFWGENVIEAEGHSWHLIAIHRRVFEAVGLFDENFYPAYEEAIDFGYRMSVLGLERGFIGVWVNAISWGSANHVDMVSCPNPPLAEYYRQKWGGPKGQELWTLPYGDKPIDYWEKLSVKQLASKYSLDVWW